ncbi:MAG: hypothetical protein KGI40_01415 [Xanthomonadaceae bacterium]|nr:hypothetical protein [Xanthomonadaceae bacterium]MDE1957734.1 hypothetical protein [Xanthomonadaceae bacterium]MDE2177214.1 hypothetical protein [Xanthomonadaceae bacterium]MDE2244598.1 hypothetical protein [Xanthomonadaceae bacterium]
MEELVDVLAVVLSLGMPIIIVVAGLVYSYRRAQLRQQLLLKLVESGQPIPAELLQPTNPTPRSPLRAAIVWAAVGLGLVVFGAMNGQRPILAAGFIPLLVGLGLLLVHWIEGRRVTPRRDSGTPEHLP